LEFLNSLRNEFSFFEYEKYKSDIENIISKHNIIEFYKFSEHKDSIMEDLEKRKLEFKSGVKYSTSLRDLDRVINGLHETDFVVVGARTSTGKTSLCLQMAYNLSKNYPVIYFSTEMPERDLRDRIICNQLGLEYFDIRIGKYTDEVLNMIKEFNRTEKSELYLSFCPSVTFESIKQTVDKISPKFVFIDYIQQIKIRQDKVREIEDFCSSMKILSGEKNCCIIAVSQLSRDLDTLSRRPRLSDLKWSGGQEESADVVLLLSRGNELGNKVYETIIDIAKQRNGPIDSITVAFDSKSMKFADIDRKE
jgi:replicative DNA helicase